MSAGLSRWFRSGRLEQGLEQGQDTRLGFGMAVREGIEAGSLGRRNSPGRHSSGQVRWGCFGWKVKEHNSAVFTGSPGHRLALLGWVPHARLSHCRCCWWECCLPVSCNREPPLQLCLALPACPLG